MIFRGYFHISGAKLACAPIHSFTVAETQGDYNR